MATIGSEPDMRVFRGGQPDNKRIDQLPAPPPWRRLAESAKRGRGEKHQASAEEIELVNAAMYLRRPLLVTGKPGTGKSSLAYAVAHELGLGEVLCWPITTRSTLAEGLYSYDAIARLQDASLAKNAPPLQAQGGAEPSTGEAEAPDIGRYIRLGPLGTALLPSAHNPPRPRVLLVDEIDKSDIDLPNDLLHIFEEGEYEIPELSRLPVDPKYERVEVFTYDRAKQAIPRGRVRANAFPVVVLTSNAEREFPPAFLRRCLRLEIAQPDPKRLARIVQERLSLDKDGMERVRWLLDEFLELRDNKERELATDQLLNAVHLAINGAELLELSEVREAIFRSLSET